ncbi:HAD-IIA family hydrolase [Halalkalibacter sp. APA_J-10(15)]|uniref:HAD-IIA family hydrolase n=1 Tax=Halalkalibacter sp. APA_J-10(15) TaxID=2933805 RepID=UPI001FF1F091|nr:HAD-IIA family hydrolase [Halalkalibacter sp. APA_J-10(15)]MCK0469944.1 HAD-IIA family hydrolase [Halalkalibacter sp. APA_J-10(15)]
MKSYQTFMIDIDGTLIRGDQLLPGAKELLQYIRQQQKQLILATNNPADTRKQIQVRLMKLGFPVEEEIATPIDAIDDFLRAESMVATILVLANERIKDEIASIGWRVKTLQQMKGDEHVSHVLVAMSNELTYVHFAKGLQALDSGASLIGLNADLYCPIKGGRAPDTGALLSVLELPTGKKALTMGKPTDWMISALKRKNQHDLEDTVMIGDSPYTDIRMGNRMEIDTILLQSGVSSYQNTELPDEATYTFQSLLEVYEQLMKL